jgi:hypothetical protein
MGHDIQLTCFIVLVTLFVSLLRRGSRTPITASGRKDVWGMRGDGPQWLTSEWQSSWQKTSLRGVKRGVPPFPPSPTLTTPWQVPCNWQKLCRNLEASQRQSWVSWSNHYSTASYTPNKLSNWYAVAAPSNQPPSPYWLHNSVTWQMSTHIMYEGYLAWWRTQGKTIYHFRATPRSQPSSIPHQNQFHVIVAKGGRRGYRNHRADLNWVLPPDTCRRWLGQASSCHICIHQRKITEVLGANPDTSFGTHRTIGSSVRITTQTRG